MSVVWRGIDAVFGELERISNEVEFATKATLREWAKALVKEEKSRASGGSGGPQKRTGTLVRSIKAGKLRFELPHSWAVTVGPHAFYRAMVEKGTTHAKPFPYVAPARAQVDTVTEEMIATGWKRAIR